MAQMTLRELEETARKLRYEFPHLDVNIVIESSHGNLPTPRIVVD